MSPPISLTAVLRFRLIVGFVFGLTRGPVGRLERHVLQIHRLRRELRRIGIGALAVGGGYFVNHDVESSVVFVE